MLKLATLSLAAVLVLASPAFAKTECIAPSKFKDAGRIEGSELTKFRKIATGLPEQVDLVLLLKDAPIALSFVKGCAVGYGIVSVAPAKPKGEGI